MSDPLRPFLKWPGGKRWLLPHVRELLNGLTYKRYIEPFLGGGAVFFGLSPKSAVLSDVNEDLINTYLQVRDHPAELVEKLKKLQADKETYGKQREIEATCPIVRAVRFLYLNRTAFGGMYRVNQQGHFNVPLCRSVGESGRTTFSGDAR